MSKQPISRTGTASLDRGLQLLASIVDDDGATPAAALAAPLNLSGSSARRVLAALERQGLIARVAKGRYSGAGRLCALATAVDMHRLLTRLARPLLARLARKHRATGHLGVLDEGMVTYLVKEGPAAGHLFTRESGQLEAYCTGVGKVLLAGLTPPEFAEFLDTTFVALTPRTITDPRLLRNEIDKVRERGYAIDDGEMDEDLYCVAVPLLGPSGRAIAALSLSAETGMLDPSSISLELSECAEEIMARASTRKGPRSST